MTALKSARTLAASLGVLVVGALAASPAMAFDKVDWDWKKDVNEYVDIDAYIDLKIDITGMVEVEKLQIFLGDLKSESYVHDIDNNPFYKESYDKDYYVPEEKKKGHHGGGGDVEINIGAICILNLICGGIGDIDFGHDGKGRHGKDDGWDKIPVKPLDARVELPILVSAASSIGNAQSITSDVPVFLHDAQFVADVKDGHGGPSYEQPAPTHASNNPWSNPGKVYDSKGGGYDYDKGKDHGSGNAFVDLALDFLSDAKYGKLKHADIDAKSVVYDVKNFSVDSSATAVANSISITLASDVDGVKKDKKDHGGPIQCFTHPCKQPGGGYDNDDATVSNHVVIADITQFALADVSAKSSVSDVSITGYNHLRELTTKELSPNEANPENKINVPTAAISSVATAVGNSVSISVGRDLTPKSY